MHVGSVLFILFVNEIFLKTTFFLQWQRSPQSLFLHENKNWHNNKTSNALMEFALYIFLSFIPTEQGP